MNIINYITENALILIPVLYIIGMILKGIERIKDKYIPLILLPIGIGLAMALMGININAIIQGVLVVGVSVYTNQLIKQINK
ncbi:MULTISPECIES: phage holin family protein [unclassified Clostridium]|uniref:phage holin family protein n=1 Tax=unclassified Clostridium TaxID=2614128 RepID=UPI000E91F24C|nr:holin [Clostridium sp.]